MKQNEDYFAAARSWAIDAGKMESRSRTIAWTVAGCACAVALIEAVALAMAFPLKEVTPITLLVDRTTGHVQEIDPTSPARIRADDALIQSLLAQYVIAREGFDRATVKSDYRRTALWSSDGARGKYLAEMPSSNPQSPFNRYRAGEVVAVEVKSVSRVAADAALVRFDTVLNGSAGRAQPLGSWISLVRYRFVNAAMSYEDRLANPLGLQVFSYRRDSERPMEAMTGTIGMREAGLPNIGAVTAAAAVGGPATQEEAR